jgi:hypothetical protein
MFVFTPLRTGPREGYLALADAESRYFSALAREEALRFHRLEHSVLRKQRDIRRGLFLSPLHEQSGYDYSYLPPSFYDPFAPAYEDDIRRHRRIALARRQQEEEEHRLIATYHARQQELERRRLAIILRREEDSMRFCHLRRQEEVGLKRKAEARREKEQFETFLGLLFGMPTEPVTAVESKRCESCKVSDCICAGLVLYESNSCLQKALEVPSQCRPANESEEAKLEAKKGGTSQREASTLKAQLENRLDNEHGNEIRDTIHAIIASLFQPQPSAPVNTSANAEMKDVKGKGKAVSFDIPPTKPTSKDILRSIEEINSIEAHFLALESDFVFPRTLDFSPTISRTYSYAGSDIKLAHTAVNAPIHNFTHALSLLLNQLDAVESYGNDDVRGRRKEVVLRVEGALQDVERVVDEKERLNRRASQESLKEVVAVDDGKEKKEATTEAFKVASILPEATGAGAELSSSSANTDNAIESSDGSTIKGYDVGDEANMQVDAPVSSPQEFTRASSTTDIAAAEVSKHGLAASVEAAPEHVVSILEQSASDTLEKGDLASAQPADKDGSDSEASVTYAETSPTSHSLLVSTTDVAEPQEPVDTFLLSRSESPSSGRTEDVVFVDEGNDWLEVDAVH